MSLHHDVGSLTGRCKGKELESSEGYLLSHGSEVKASAWNAGDLGLIPGLGRSPGEGSGNPLYTLAWIIPWREEPGRLQSMESQSRT